MVILPVLGPLFLLFILYIRKGSKSTNMYGLVQGTASDYFRNPDPKPFHNSISTECIVNDVSQLNPVIVANVETPCSTEELQNIVRKSEAISIGGGRFSMGGQTASPGSVHISMKCLNKILDFSVDEQRIKVQAGIRWCDIQRHIDNYGLSIKIMQTYANFTVGGSLSVNCHGRYIGLGPIILSVISLDVMLSNGELVHTSPTNNAELFYACIGCYNAVAIIVNVELELVENVRVKRLQKKMKLEEYKKYFVDGINHNKSVVFHNADIYPPKNKNVRAVSWVVTNDNPTTKTKLIPLASAYPIERYFIGAFGRSNFGKWRREFIIDPLYYKLKRVHWRNYEAGYDVLELEPNSRKKSTYVLQEYFVEIEKLEQFVGLMTEIFTRFNVNVINISIRHSKADKGSLLAWARSEDVFAFVVWYKQSTTDEEKRKVSIWTRELIDSVITLGGSYYLPYQQHATEVQFHKAYPRAMELFKLKKKFDPEYKFRNIIWDKYYVGQQYEINI